MNSHRSPRLLHSFSRLSANRPAGISGSHTGSKDSHECAIDPSKRSLASGEVKIGSDNQQAAQAHWIGMDNAREKRAANGVVGISFDQDAIRRDASLYQILSCGGGFEDRISTAIDGRRPMRRSRAQSDDIAVVAAALDGAIQSPLDP